MISISSIGDPVAPRRPSARTELAAKRIGEYLVTWRKLHGLTAAQVAERAQISRGTLTALESGKGGVRLGTFLGVARSLGVLDRVVEALDPYESDLGRARADEVLPKRVRR
ncbi:helix-turn-helix transcriptional regulator [Myceligenerans xiligouense]|uniref:helix-turn-helix domain-containing protein n=1 Tax=Myceligenerans xiligouense TaxID=253184 RepID=UPI00319E4D53